LLLFLALCACGSSEDRQPEPEEVKRYIAKMERDEAAAKAAAIRESRAREQVRDDAARARTSIPERTGPSR
jgi:hypothetical protein